MTTYRQLQLGEPAPWFHQRNTSNPRYAFDTVAGRYIVLCFFATAEDAVGQAALALVDAHHAMFDETRFAFFGVSNDPADEHSGRVVQRIPGVRHFWDFDGKVARLYGALPDGTDTRLTSVRRQWVVLDPALQVVGIIHFRPDGTDRDTLLGFLRGLPPVSHYGGVEMHAPVILQPHVFEPALCAHLIRLYEADGGEESGFMRDEAGKTVGVYDHGHKSRQDLVLSDTALCRQLQQRIFQKVVPTSWAPEGSLGEGVQEFSGLPSWQGQAAKTPDPRATRGLVAGALTLPPWQAGQWPGVPSVQPFSF